MKAIFLLLNHHARMDCTCVQIQNTFFDCYCHDKPLGYYHEILDIFLREHILMNFLKQEIAIIKGIELIRAPIGRIQIKENAQQICILLQQSRKPEV